MYQNNCDYFVKRIFQYHVFQLASRKPFYSLESLPKVTQKQLGSQPNLLQLDRIFHHSMQKLAYIWGVLFVFIVLRMCQYNRVANDLL